MALQEQPSEITTAAGGRLFGEVLCGIDGTRSCYEAVRQAAALAGPGGRLALVTISGRSGAGRQQGASISTTRSRRSLQHATRLAERAGVDAEASTVEEGAVADALLERARGHELLALGAPSMSRLAHVILGGVATAAVHAMPCSLLIARRPPTGVDFPQRILVASDAGEDSRRLVTLAARLARHHRASLLVLHIAGPEGRFAPARLAAQSDLVRVALGEGASVRVEAGRPKQLITETAAAERASLVVVGNGGADGVRALGSVSERVAHEAPCSVLVAKLADLPA